METLELLEEQIAPRTNLPPLLERLNERRAENLDYLGTIFIRIIDYFQYILDYSIHLGVSFGLTPELLKFWKKCSFVPVYCRQEASSLTGEHTLISLKNLNSQGIVSYWWTNINNNVIIVKEWLSSFSSQFRNRFINLLPSAFSHFPSTLALSILQLRNKEIEGSMKRRGTVFI